MSHRVSNTPINPPLIRLILYRNTLHKRAYKHTGENIDRYYKRCCSRRGDAVAATRVTRSQSQVWDEDMEAAATWRQRLHRGGGSMFQRFTEATAALTGRAHCPI